jgi:hypothetical protein
LDDANSFMIPQIPSTQPLRTSQQYKRSISFHKVPRYGFHTQI